MTGVTFDNAVLWSEVFLNGNYRQVLNVASKVTREVDTFSFCGIPRALKK